MRIESKKMKKGMDKWYKTAVHRDTQYYNVLDFKDGSKLVTFLADEYGRVFRIILSKHDMERLNGAVAIEESNAAKKGHGSSPRQNQRPLVILQSGQEQEGSHPEVDILALSPDQ